jgi:hypothetical protein
VKRDTVKHWIDGRKEITLDREDVDLARVYLQEGYSKIEVAREFHQSGYMLHHGVAIAHCAAQEIERDLVVRKKG